MRGREQASSGVMTSSWVRTERMAYRTMEDGASSIVPYAILSVLTQLGVITPEEACSLPRFHDKNLYNNHHAVVGRTELAFQLEPLC